MTEQKGRSLDRRRAAVLFADLSGFSSRVGSLGAERAHRQVGECLERMGAVVVRHGGYVHQYEGDCLMALFGTPVAIERASRAAVGAALEIQRCVAAYSQELALAEPLRVHSGISSGVLLAGAMRRYSADSFGVIGSCVIEASRLKDAAPRGETYVGPDTYFDTRGDFEFAEVGALELRGLPEPVVAYRVVSSGPVAGVDSTTARHDFSVPLLGREAELATLRHWIESSPTRTAGASFVLGDAGSGKSRVVRELASSVSARDVRWLVAQARSESQRASYHPIADLLRTWLELSAERDPIVARDRLEAAAGELLGHGAASSLPYLAQMLGLPLHPEEQRHLRDSSPEAVDLGTRDCIVEFLRALAQRAPIVIAFEDLHWSDRSTVRLLEATAPALRDAQVSFLFTTRPGYVETTGRVLAAFEASLGEHARVVSLNPLEPAASRRLVAALLDLGGFSRDLEEEISRRAKGNPFFAEQIVRWMSARRREEGETGRDAVPNPAPLELPGNVHDVLQSRIASLDSTTALLLRVISVAGRAVHAPVLEEIGASFPEFDRHVADLLESRLLVPTDALETRGFELAHPLIQEVAYGSIPEDERPALHLRVAEAVEKRLPPHLHGFDAMLAYHYSRCDDPALAEGYLDAAGEAASRLAATEEAVHFFGEAVEAFLATRKGEQNPDRGAELERKLAVAHMNRGDLKQAVTHFDRALDHLGERRSRSRRAEIVQLARTAGRVASELYAPRLRPRRPPATERQRSIIEIMYARAQAETTHDPRNFVRDTLIALARLSRVDPHSIDRAGAMYASAVGIFSFGGVSFGIGRRLLDLGRPLVKAADASDAFLYRTMAFLHNYLSGDWSTDHLIALAEVDDTIARGRLWEVTTYCNLEAAYRTFRGEFSRAEALIDRLDAIHARYGFALAASARDGVSAYVALERRDLPAAHRAAEHYLNLHTAPLFNVIALGTLAKIDVLRGDLDAASVHLERAEVLLSRTSGVTPYHANHPRCAALLLTAAKLERASVEGDRRGRAALAREAARAGRAAARVSARFSARRPEVLRLLGTTEWLSGRRRSAVRTWERALVAAETLGQRLELQRIFAEAGRHLRDFPAVSLSGLDSEGLIARAQELEASSTE